MPNDSQKLKQRAELLSILNKYRNATKINNQELFEDIEQISKFENKEFVLKTLLQEIVSSNETYSNICSIIALESIDNATFEGIAINFLQDKKTPDNKKFIIVSLMKQKGLEFNYRDIADYVDNVEELAHSGVQDFLKNAINDPEAQIDLLDFFINIPQEEKTSFLYNLQEEFEGDNLANAFSILSQLDNQKEENDILLKTLLESNSPYAIEGLEYILDNQTFDTKTRGKIKKKIKKIKANNPNFTNDLLVKNSEIYKCNIGFIDGKSNFTLTFSRKKDDDTINVLLATANITQGIISCMGFCSIDIENYDSITKRLFNDSPAIKITPIALKTLFEHYYSKSIQNNIELPYELIVWKKIFNKTRTINYDISEFINSKLEITKLTKEKVKKFASSKMLETWYYSVGQNEFVDGLISQIEQKHILDLDEINELTSKLIEEKFLNNKDFKQELQSKLLLQSYIAHLAKLKMTSACAYSLCFKNPYTKMLLESSIDKSLYYYFSTKAYELEEDNIFKKNIKTNYTKEELEILMAQLEEKWS